MAEQNSYDFWTRYSNLCLKCKVCPLKSIIKHIRGTTLCFLVERIRNEHWQFLLSALSIDNSLTEVCFKSDLPSLEEQKELWKKRRRKLSDKYPVPYGYSAFNVNEICKYSARLLIASQTLQKLVIENLPITKEDAEHLAEGLKVTCIKEFAFRCYPYPDEVIEIVCRGIHYSKVSLLDFSDCNLSFLGLQYICNVIKKHKDRRLAEAFPELLRHQQPVYEGLPGLNRVTLNANPIGDRGVAVIFETICDDRCMSALDLQCCGISNAGAITIWKQLASNTTVQVVDLRLNDVDKVFLEKISLQLDMNKFGKLIHYSPMALWKSRQYSKAMSVRKNKLKAKVVKKYCRTPAVKRREPKGSGLAVRISCIKERNDSNMKDALVQTEERDQVKNFNKRIQKLEDRILKELQLRENFLEVMQKLKTDNENLRQEVLKLSTFDDAILIDQETYSEIKHVFEKIQQFLKVMKEKNLWGLVTTIGIDEYENAKLGAVPADAKVAAGSNAYNGRQPNGPTRRSSVPKLQMRKCSCCNPQCVSNQRAMQTNNETPINHVLKDTQDKLQSKYTINKAKVAKVFKDVKETYSGCDFLKQPSSARRLSSEGLPVESGSPPSNTRHLSPKCTCSSNLNQNFYDFKTPQELFNAVKNEVDRHEHHYHVQSLCPCTHPPRHCMHSNHYIRNVSSQTAATDLSLNSRTLNPPISSRSESYVSQRIDPSVFSNSLSSVKSLPIDIDSKSLPSDAYPIDASQQAINLVSREMNGNSSKSVSEASKKKSSDSTPFEKSRSEASAKGNASDQSNQNSKSEVNSTSAKPLNSLPKSSSHHSEKKPNPPSAIIDSQAKIKSEDASSRNEDSSKSYLESVDDDSTDKDVKSFSEIEVYSSDHKSDSSTFKKNGKTPAVAKNIAAKNPNNVNSSASGNSSKSSKKDQKHKKNSNRSAASGKKTKKDSDSSSSVPSLSDITTVSSRSLNTDSVMGQLSGSEKGLS